MESAIMEKIKQMFVKTIASRGRHIAYKCGKLDGETSLKRINAAVEIIRSKNFFYNDYRDSAEELRKQLKKIVKEKLSSQFCTELDREIAGKCGLKLKILFGYKCREIQLAAVHKKIPLKQYTGNRACYQKQKINIIESNIRTSRKQRMEDNLYGTLVHDKRALEVREHTPFPDGVINIVMNYTHIFEKQLGEQKTIKYHCHYTGYFNGVDIYKWSDMLSDYVTDNFDILEKDGLASTRVLTALKNTNNYTAVDGNLRDIARMFARRPSGSQRFAQLKLDLPQMVRLVNNLYHRKRSFRNYGGFMVQVERAMAFDDREFIGILARKKLIKKARQRLITKKKLSEKLYKSVDRKRKEAFTELYMEENKEEIAKRKMRKELVKRAGRRVKTRVKEAKKLYISVAKTREKEFIKLYVEEQHKKKQNKEEQNKEELAENRNYSSYKKELKRAKKERKIAYLLAKKAKKERKRAKRRKEKE